MFAGRSDLKLSAARDVVYWFSRADRCNEQPAVDYKEEAWNLLEAEFVWFSLFDLREVFDSCRNLYAITWRALDEAGERGFLAEFPLHNLRSPRRSEPTIPGTACHARLNAELASVLAWRARKRSEFNVWADGLFYSFDVDGLEQLLDADGAQVMMQWERPYMEHCVDILNITADSHVLEIGFGCGYSAEKIQNARPQSHTIIECASKVLERLQLWAASRPGVVIVEGTWQERLPELGVFDCIFFDDYGTPGRSDREMDEHCPDHQYREEYAESTAKEHGTHFHGFLNIALRWHTRTGTRISGYLEHPIQLQREDAYVLYERMPVSPPPHCNYFPCGLCQHAIVPLFVKKSCNSCNSQSWNGRRQHSSCQNNRWNRALARNRRHAACKSKPNKMSAKMKVRSAATRWRQQYQQQSSA